MADQIIAINYWFEDMYYQALSSKTSLELQIIFNNKKIDQLYQNNEKVLKKLNAINDLNRKEQKSVRSILSNNICFDKINNVQTTRLIPSILAKNIVREKYSKNLHKFCSQFNILLEDDYISQLQHVKTIINLLTQQIHQEMIQYNDIVKTILIEIPQDINIIGHIIEQVTPNSKFVTQRQDLLVKLQESLLEIISILFKSEQLIPFDIIRQLIILQ